MNPPMTDWIPSQRDSDAEIMPITWRQHGSIPVLITSAIIKLASIKYSWNKCGAFGHNWCAINPVPPKKSYSYFYNDKFKYLFIINNKNGSVQMHVDDKSTFVEVMA